MSAQPMPALFPSEVFDTAALRHLDAPARDAIVQAGRLREIDAGALLYTEAEPSDSFFVIIDGSVELRAVRRGEQEASSLRTARRGDTFGEEATLLGLTRRATARACELTRVVEIPIAVFRRATGRTAASRESEREGRYLRRAVIRDLVFASALGRGLSENDIDVLLDAAELRRIARGAHLYSTGDRADAFFLLAEGLVQLQEERDARVSVLAYISRGDFFGDEDLVSGRDRRTDAVAAGDAWCVRLPIAAFRHVADRNPGLLAGLRRVASAEHDRQAEVIGGANSTQHVFHDLYRMQVARSLLVIDQDSCVRCGHCAWSCSEVHGASRLVRRGDKVLVGLTGANKVAVPTTLSLPNTCQHCRNAACMVDCPTGAIGRDLRGEVFIREDLCTGCGKCAKACPWDNISMAPRSVTTTQAGKPEPGALVLSADVAVKCDLCRDFESPACVQACPTESIFRIDPERDIAEVRLLLGAVSSTPSEGAQRTALPGALSSSFVLIAGAIALAIAMGGLGYALQRAEVWRPSSAAGLIAALVSAVLILLLTGYVVPKRGVRRWMRRRPRLAPARRVPGGLEHAAAPRSRMKPKLVAHVVMGLAACATTIAHVGPRFPSTVAGALHIAFWLAVLTGALGGLFYVSLPRRLSRLEGRSALPEDLRGQRQQLLDRLYRESSGRGELVKAIASRVLVPYARSLSGAVALAFAGRDLAEERRRLRRRIDQMLESRGKDRLEGLDPLIKIVVDLRAAPSRRVLTTALRAWLPIHILAVGLTLGLLALHILLVAL